ncbi:sensor histidine kinase [Polynucleobacter sp. CS-Odin-A6]|uniref:sensor histidine kinase n=1 Tax=Polynucleobacter sp. CS-Odin-A6 TaxID=2689106 RepID=UPI001C0E431A|nr:HAMP domain-containing sensor histidine kinase [Polynucleobacter sp. CS-Odin-A6]MBU3622001.1 HAMP domain-containing histidine kinase [Polynucleobacter sp. CS-Odin-A6]
MNPFIPISIVYALMTLGSASTLYFSFRGKVDTSGRYFLLSEVLMILVMVQVIGTNIYPDYLNIPTLFIGNFLHLASDAAMFISIYTLTRKTTFLKYVGFLIFAAIYCGFIELIRVWDSNLPVVLFSLWSAVIAIAIYLVCKSSPNNELNENLFLKWIRYIEIGLLCFAILRIASYFTNDPIVPRQPSTSVSLLYTLLVVLSVFRYISYQSLRISWFDPRRSSENPLNRNMTKLTKEKNQFLQGLISSNRAIGISALANSLAHQLSQPITGVILQTETVKRDLLELGGQQRSVDTLNTVTDQLQRLSALVNNLRRLFSTQAPDKELVKVQEVCDEILEIIEPTLASKNIQLTKQYQANPLILGNTIQIQQVLINLFNNGVDAIVLSNSKKREIVLTISQDDSSAFISVQDSGDGIDTEIKHSMFELYQTSKKDGMGIGLWLCKEIIEKHDGKIYANSGPQGGAIFEISLPLNKI